MPPEVSESEIFRAMHTQAEAFLNIHGTSGASSSLPASLESSDMQDNRVEDNVDAAAAVPSNDSGSSREAAPQQSSENESRSSEASAIRGGGEKEIIEQFEPGVYITYVHHRNGGKIFRQVRFRYLIEWLILLKFHMVIHT